MSRSLVCRSLIIKVASRCNLNCTYCYVYHQGDTTYRSQPKVMHPNTVTAIIARVRSHCQRHGIRHFEFIFHGGEPLLVNPTFLGNFVAEARTALTGVTLSFSLQTNGVLLTEAWCRWLKAAKVYVGISLDGPEAVHDRARVDHGGRGSYRRVVRGIRNAQRTGLRFGVLSVIDVASNPGEVYAHLRSLTIERINFLLPYGSHDHPPPGLWHATDDTPYADWLLTVFDRWWDEAPPKPRVRLFEQTLQLALGSGGGYEALGSRNLELLVVETDGSIEAAGSLKVCGDGFTKAHVNVREHELDEALRTDLARQYHLSHRRLPPACTRCPVNAICGGGHLVHRYRSDNGFDNPSVLCRDMMKFITHVRQRLREVLPTESPAALNTG